MEARTSPILPRPHPRPIMNTHGGKAYRPWTPELYAQQAHAPAAKLPQDDLVFFLLDVVPKLLFNSFAWVFDVSPLLMDQGSCRSPDPGATPHADDP